MELADVFLYGTDFSGLDMVENLGEDDYEEIVEIPITNTITFSLDKYVDALRTQSEAGFRSSEKQATLR